MVLDRRHFLQLSTTPLFVAAVNRRASAARSANITENGNGIRVQGKTYSWEYSPQNDVFRLLDTQARIVTTGSLRRRSSSVLQPSRLGIARKADSALSQ